MKSTNLDEIAFNHLAAGDTSKALDIWSKRENVSSLQNTIVCLLIKEEYQKALSLAQKLYGDYGQEFIDAIIGDTKSGHKEDLLYNFVSQIRSKISPFDILDTLSSSSERESLAKTIISPLEEKIAELIANAKKGDKTIIRAKLLAMGCSPYLGEIYSLSKYVSGGDILSQRLSTKIGEQMLSMIIDDVNKEIKDFNNSSHSLYPQERLAHEFEMGLVTISMIRELRLERSFAEGRLAEQGAVLQRLYDGTKHLLLYQVLLFRDTGAKQLDLRDSREHYSSCKSAADYKLYCERYPFAYNYDEAYGQYETLLYESCKSESDYKGYLKDFPSGKYAAQVKARLEDVLYQQCDTIKKCEEYIELYPTGKYVDAVRDRLSLLRE